MSKEWRDLLMGLLSTTLVSQFVNLLFRRNDLNLAITYKDA